MLHIETTRIGNTVEISDGEFGIVSIAITHDGPYEQRKDCLTELLEVTTEIKDTMIIKRDRDADIMQ